MKNLLVALDLDNPKHTDIIIEHTIKLGKAFESKCWLIHIATPDPEFADYEVGPQYIRDEIAEEFRGEHRQIQRLADKIKAAGIECDGLLIQGPTEEMLLEEIKKLKIDMLVLGNKKKGFFQEVFLGSVTDDIIKDVSVPVFLIPLDRS